MEALIADIENEINFIFREMETLKRKKEKNKISQLGEVAIKSFDLFKKDWEIFKKHMQGESS